MALHTRSASPRCFSWSFSRNRCSRPSIHINIIVLCIIRYALPHCLSPKFRLHCTRSSLRSFFNQSFCYKHRINSYRLIQNTCLWYTLPYESFRSFVCTLHFFTFCIDYQRKMRCIHHSILSTLSALQSALLKFESVGAGSNLLHRTRGAVATV